MSAKPLIRLRASVTLLAVWTCAGIAINGIAQKSPSEEKLLQHLRLYTQAMMKARPDERQVTDVAMQLALLTAEERERVLTSSEMRAFTTFLSEDQRTQFIQLALASGIPELMSGFDTAPVERRTRWVNQALNELEQLRMDGQSEEPAIIDDSEAQRISQSGLAEFWRNADSTSRIGVLPLLERIQSILQIPR